MKVCDITRQTLYSVLSLAFRNFGIKPHVIELGVLKGENARNLFDALSPELLILVDAWSQASMVAYTRENAHRHWVVELNSFADYYGGDLSKQETFDRIYDVACSKFAGIENVHIIRSDTQSALSEIKSRYVSGRNFDLIYVDANHQYETVFDDLMFYQDILSETGVFQLNDCCHSDLGIQQNLGVLEAVTRFVKLSQFVPVALTNGEWSDVLLVRRNSPMIEAINVIIDQSAIRYVELPHQFLGAARVQGATGNISFL